MRVHFPALISDRHEAYTIWKSMKNGSLCWYSLDCLRRRKSRQKWRRIKIYSFSRYQQQHWRRSTEGYMHCIRPPSCSGWTCLFTFEPIRTKTDIFLFQNSCQNWNRLNSRREMREQIQAKILSLYGDYWHSNLTNQKFMSSWVQNSCQNWNRLNSHREMREQIRAKMNEFGSCQPTKVTCQILCFSLDFVPSFLRVNSTDFDSDNCFGNRKISAFVLIGSKVNKQVHPEQLGGRIQCM